MAGNDARYRLIPVANQHFFPVPHELDMGAELGLQVADIYAAHKPIVADMTMLVMSVLGWAFPTAD